MPKWWVHDKWAVKFGITLTSQDLNWINDLVDFPKKHVPNWLAEHVGHDWGRDSKWEIEIQVPLARERYGHQGYLAVHLHHLLDILDEFTNPQKRQQMAAFQKATKEAEGTSGIVYRFDGRDTHISPSWNTTQRVIPKVAREIQGLLGKCDICKGSLGGEPHIELTNMRGKNICAHVRCLRKEEASESSNTMQIRSENRVEAIEKPVPNLMQIKKELMTKAIKIGLDEGLIELVMKHIWEILNDIENTRDLTTT
jgi:hypothetical protein